MADTTVITHEEPDPEDPSVLAQAAVAAAALAGASAAKADDAQGDAESAESNAELAVHQAATAITVAETKVDESRAREIAREELLAALAEALQRQEPAPPPPVAEPINPQVLPPSVEKANKSSSGRGKWARIWEEG